MIKIRRLDHGLPLPKYQTSGSVGIDLYSTGDLVLEPGDRARVGCGIAVDIPMGFEGQVRPRSGLAYLHGITMPNSPGTIDQDYRGEICVLLQNSSRIPVRISRGARVAQLVISPVVRADIQEVSELADTDRGVGGFGSTGP